MVTPSEELFSADEREVLAQVSATLRSQGVPTRFPIEQLLRSWTLFAARVADTKSLPEEFAEYLMRRDTLEMALRICPEPLAQKLMLHVHAADEKYRNATVDDEGRSMSKRWRIREGWWWRRRPSTGPLARLLDNK